MELIAIKESLCDYNDKLGIKKKELEKKNIEIEDLEAKIKVTKLKASPNKNQIKKKYIQTSLFKPPSSNKQISNDQIKELISRLESIKFDSISQVDIKEQIVELRKTIYKWNLI